MRVVYWGTYDIGKPRNRIMIRGLQEHGIEVIECHANIWKGVEDKSQLSKATEKARCVLRLLLCYPLLIYRYLRLPPHDYVVVGYMGQCDVLVLWLFAYLRGVPICWDVFISLYETAVVDRKTVSEKSIVALLLYVLEWLGTRAASQLLLDTRSHAQYFAKCYRISPRAVDHVYVGAELEVFRKRENWSKDEGVFRVLFYGQFIPLHGIDTIVHAAKILEKSRQDVCWMLVGKGQEQPRIDRLIRNMGLKSIRRISWVPYEQLIEYITHADVCLGIFGASGKATRVIPNKVYQILAAGKPLITSDSHAIREILHETPTVRLVEAGNPNALAAAVVDLRKTLEEVADAQPNSYKAPQIGYVEVGNQFLDILKSYKQHV